MRAVSFLLWIFAVSVHTYIQPSLDVLQSKPDEADPWTDWSLDGLRNTSNTEEMVQLSTEESRSQKVERARIKDIVQRIEEKEDDRQRTQGQRGSDENLQEVDEENSEAKQGVGEERREDGEHKEEQIPSYEERSKQDKTPDDTSSNKQEEELTMDTGLYSLESAVLPPSENWGVSPPLSLKSVNQSVSQHGTTTDTQQPSSTNKMTSHDDVTISPTLEISLSRTLVVTQPNSDFITHSAILTVTQATARVVNQADLIPVSPTEAKEIVLLVNTNGIENNSLLVQNMTDNPMTQPGKKDATVSTTMAARRALTFKAVPSTQQARDHKAHQKKLTAKSKSKQTTKAKKAKKAKMPRKEKETKAKPLKKVQKTRKSKQEKKENPTAPPYFPYFKENYCPPECACYGRVVQCSDKGIEKIPYGIPYNSRYILLMNNRIDSIQLDLLPEYIHLEFLVLSNNRLTDGAIEGAFEGIQGLKRLYMDHNLLQSVPTDLPSSLEELRLDDNQLSVMSEAAWGRCSNLMVLSLSNNSLGNLSDPLPAGVLSSLGSLRTLNLNHNQLDSVPLQLPLSLQELYLRGNHIQRLPASVFQGQTKLLVLDLSVNWLTDKGLGKGVLAKASHLESLNLEGNRLRQVPRHLPASLKTLNLEGNAISSVGKSAFLGLPQLELLGLGKNKIARVAPTAFLRLPHLHQLDLSHNNLRQVPRKLPPWLHTASLAHNKITEVPRDAFCWGSPKPPLSRLTSVQLENNLLDMGGLNGSAFRCLRGFQVVHFY